MIENAYQTLACRLHDTKAIARGIDHARIEERLEPVFTPYQKQKVKHLYLLPRDDDLTPAFTQPFPYNGFENDPNAYIIDGRLFFKMDRDRQQSITNADEYSQQIKRGVLTHYWNHHAPVDLLRLGDLPVVVYCRWLGETLSKRYGLSRGEQANVVAITYLFWFHLFNNEPGALSNEKAIHRLTTRLSQLFAISPIRSDPILQALPVMASITDYVAALKAHAQTPRFEQLTPAFLYAMLGGSWFGLNHRETVAVSIEHPPTFLTLIDASLNSRNYKQSVIGRLVDEANRRHRGDFFQKTLRVLLQDYFG